MWRVLVYVDKPRFTSPDLLVFASSNAWAKNDGHIPR